MNQQKRLKTLQEMRDAVGADEGCPRCGCCDWRLEAYSLSNGGRRVCRHCGSRRPHHDHAPERPRFILPPQEG